MLPLLLSWPRKNSSCLVPHVLDLVGPLLDGELDVEVDLVQTKLLEPSVPHHPGQDVSQVAHTALYDLESQLFLPRHGV